MGDPACDILALQRMPIGELLRKYKALFEVNASGNNPKFLMRKIAYRIQEAALGSLLDSVRNRIDELIKAYDPINKRTFKTRGGNLPTVTGRDPRLPMPGSLIVKNYKGQKIEVKVLEKGFEYQGVVYKNLSLVAKAITGNHWNGFGFFGLKNGKR